MCALLVQGEYLIVEAKHTKMGHRRIKYRRDRKSNERRYPQMESEIKREREISVDEIAVDERWDIGDGATQHTLKAIGSPRYVKDECRRRQTLLRLFSLRATAFSKSFEKKQNYKAKLSRPEFPIELTSDHEFSLLHLLHNLSYLTVLLFFFLISVPTVDASYGHETGA